MMKRFLTAITLPALLLTSCNLNYRIENDISYAEYGERSLLDIAFPKHNKETSLIIFIHGGAWVGGSKSSWAKDWSNKYNDGYIYAAINYRYINEKYHCDDMLNDIQRATLKIKEICEDKDYHINKVAYFGQSAGAHLSLLYSYKMRDVCPFEIGFVSSMCGPTDLTDEKYISETVLGNGYYELVSYLTGITIDETNFSTSKEELLKCSPINYVNKACPTIICHGDEDEIVPYSNAESLKNKLTEANVKHDFFCYSGSGHGLDKSKEIDKEYNETFKEYKAKYL